MQTSQKNNISSFISDAPPIPTRDHMIAGNIQKGRGIVTIDNILIIEDDRIARNQMCNYIDFLGFNYDTAKDAEVAVKKLKDKNYAIVLTNINMVHMDGLGLLKYIHEKHPRIGVIAITHVGHNCSYTSLIKAGASDFIATPFNSDELEAKLNRVLRETNLIRQLEQYSIGDALTGLYNRRFFESKILAEVKRAERQRYEIFLLMIDVDNFKGYNDKYGHQSGDKLLQEMGCILLQSIRENVDWAFRYGGDEFCVIFTQVDTNKIAILAKRILKKYYHKKFMGTGLSIGIASFTRHVDRSWPEDIADLVLRADKALYCAKKQGKNRMAFDEVLQFSELRVSNN